MIKRAVVYEETTGRIVEMLSCPAADFMRQEFQEGTAVLEIAEDAGVGFETHYVETGAVVAKQAMSLVVDRTNASTAAGDVVTISNIPTNTLVEVTGLFSEIVDDGVIEFSVDLPGVYVLRFINVPYVSEEVVIEVVPAA